MTDGSKPNIVVTGISGDLGSKLLPMLAEYEVTGIDLVPPSKAPFRINFVRLDLGLEESCRELFLLMRTLRPVAVVHLAFASATRVLGRHDFDQMWQLNVGGTARVVEALTEVNRDEEIIKKFVFVSCVYAYGTQSSDPASEDQKLAADSLPIAIQKMEADDAVQQRAPAARGSSVYLLRPAMFAGTGAANHLLEVFRGEPRGRGKLGLKLAKNGNIVPCIFPWGKKYLEKSLQFVHTDDVARVITFILRKTEPESRRLTILNIAAKGESLTVQRCADIARIKIMRVPGEWVMRRMLEVLWRTGISSIPPEAAGYLCGTPTMKTDRIREFLGPYYENVIQHTSEHAFVESVTASSHQPVATGNRPAGSANNRDSN